MEILLRIAAVMAEAQRLVAHTAASDEIIQAAKLTAEGVIKTLYADVGWQVGVSWPAPAGVPATAEAAR